MKHKERVFAVLILLFLFLVIGKLSYWYFSPLKINQVRVEEDTTKTGVKYVLLFDSIDEGLNKLLLERNSHLALNALQEIKKKVRVSNPVLHLDTVKDKRTINAQLQKSKTNPNVFFPHKETQFYLICNPGFIENTRGAVQYYLPGGTGKYYYEVSLRKGTYGYQTISEPRDSVTFVVDEKGAYKLGFQELHPNFVILKDTLP